MDMNTSGQGGIKAVIFDWAGTLVDHGSRAPMGVFVEVFARFGVAIGIEEARAPMGLPKWDHIFAVGTAPRVAGEWRRVHGRPFSAGDADELYEVFRPLNIEVAPHFAELIPGVLETVAELRARDVKLGSTTGYSRAIMDAMMPVVEVQGLAVDCLVCADDLAASRPTPLMMYQCFVELGVWPAAACIKVDDTAPGIDEGRAAGTWTVGVAMSGNALGLSQSELESLDPVERSRRREAAYAHLHEAGAHLVIDSVAELMPAIAVVERWLAEGRQP